MASKDLSNKKEKSSTNLGIKYTDRVDDRGAYQQYPEGTKSRHFEVTCDAFKTKIHAVIYFLPDGNRYFNFITPSLSETFMAYSAAEVNTISIFIQFIAKNRGKFYSTGTGTSPAGPDQKPIEPTQPTNQGD